MNAPEAEQIVRDLAERGPFGTGFFEFECKTCEQSFGFVHHDEKDPTRHDPDCLWRRAVEATREG